MNTSGLLSAQSRHRPTSQKAVAPTPAKRPIGQQLESCSIWEQVRKGSIDKTGGGQVLAVDADLNLYTWNGNHLLCVNLREMQREDKPRVQVRIPGCHL